MTPPKKSPPPITETMTPSIQKLNHNSDSTFPLSPANENLSPEAGLKRNKNRREEKNSKKRCHHPQTSKNNSPPKNST